MTLSRCLRILPAMASGVLLALAGCATINVEPMVNDAVSAPLTSAPGDPQRGRAVVANRQVGLCLLCHTAPIAEERFQGDLAPSLAGAGARLSAGQLRLRLMDNRRINPETIMPPYFQADGMARVGTAWQARTVLSAQQIEDVVAYLGTLR